MKLVKHSKIGTYLADETERGLKRWLYFSVSIMTVLAFSWVTYSYTSGMSTTAEVINSIVENRSNTFSEMSIQRDLEQFIATGNAGGLIRFNVLIDRGGTTVARVGTLSKFGLTRKWELGSITSPHKYRIQLNSSLLPFMIIYAILFAGIILTYRWMLRSSMATFKRSFETISNELEKVLAEISGEVSVTGGEKDFQEVSDLRRLSSNWRKQLETYRQEIAALYFAEAESKIAQQVAHDIRSPLSVLKILSKINGSLTSEHQQIIGSAVDRIGKIADNLHEVAKSSLSRSKVKTVNQTEIERIWAGLVQEKSIEAQDRSIEFRLDSDWLEADTIHVRDELQMYRTLSNLINNSLAAVPPDQACKVSLKLSRTAEHLGLELCDNGKGMPTEIRERIGPTPVSESGTGIGLSTASRWMNDEGGRLSVESSPGAGTKIVMLWPR